MPESYVFPKDFIWGAATASYQIEGAADLDGRKPSVWDTFSRRPGGVRTGETGDIANDHYHRFDSDLALMASLGIKHYRCSLAWPRIIPDGRGAVNEAGIDFYKRLFDSCAKHGITPHVTLFHWDSPQALEDRYGSWRSREIADDFADYVAVAVKRLGDRVSHWMTMNEIPCFTFLGYATKLSTGMHAPGTQVGSQKEVWQTVHHALLAHGKAVQAIRANSPRPCTVSVVDNTSAAVPVSESPADIAAARQAMQDMWCNGNVIYPLLTGRYSDAFLRNKGAKGELPDIKAGDLEIIAQKLDGVGLNVYSGNYVRAAANAEGFETLELPPGYPRLDMPWLNFVPDAIYWAARHVNETLGFKGDLFIAENGCAAQDHLNERGEVIDLDRIVYLRENLRQVHRATAEGLPMKGYFVWSFMDNFEWTWGYAKRFGIVWNTYETQERIPKQSAKWYAECIRQNRVV